jgi:hypothetical protein
MSFILPVFYDIVKDMKKIVFYWSIALILIAVSFFGFILYRYFAVNGELNLTYDFSKEPTLISEITPLGRVTNRLNDVSSGDTYQIMSGEPTYFTITAPRSFDSAEVSITYSNPSQKIVELGLRKSADWIFELKPLENKFIDDSSWSRLTKDSLILLQKQEDYASVDDFTANLPKDKNVAFYNYTPRYNFALDNYIPSGKILEINQAVRGRQEFYTYLGANEDLDFSFVWLDSNLNTADSLMIKVLKGDTEIFSDGSITPEEKNIYLTDLSGGLYKIILDATDDAVFSQIKTQQQYLVLKNKIYLATAEAENIFTNSDTLLFYTNSFASLQNIKIGEQKFSLDNIEKFAKWKDTNSELNDLKEVSFSNADILMQGAGYFSFTQDSFFDPDYNFTTLNSDIDISQYDYILAADYNKPVKLPHWKTATQQFNLTGVPGDRKTLEFTISAPGLADVKENITIKEISIKLKREPLTLSNLWEKITARLK